MTKDTQHEINEKLDSFFRKGEKRSDVNLYSRFYECDYDEVMEEDFDDYVQFNVEHEND